MRFTTTVELGGKTATGFVVPDEVVTALDSGRRPAVVVTVGGHTYRSTVASMGGRSLVPLSAENRTAAGVAADDEIDVDIELDTAPREVRLPADLADALQADPNVRDQFEALSHSNRTEWARWIEDAKRPATRSRRVSDAIAGLRDGKRNPSER